MANQTPQQRMNELETSIEQAHSHYYGSRAISGYNPTVSHLKTSLKAYETLAEESGIPTKPKYVDLAKGVLTVERILDPKYDF